jgi:chemotaxis protein methyltransferase CheR
MPPHDGESLSKDLTDDQFERFRDYIHQHSGIFLESSKADSLRISLITRATRFGFDGLDDYFELLTEDEREFKEPMNLITINETSFFRFPAQFEALRQEVVPEILDAKPSTQNSFRIWSAGCSTGEEPYSIAMTLLDSGLEGLGYSPEVLGTDVSTNALEIAKEAVYPSRALLSVPTSMSSRFFEPTAKGHRVAPKPRHLVDFQFHNLIKEPYPLGPMGN